MKLIAAALGGAAVAVLVVWQLVSRGVIAAPPHVHPDKRDLEAEVAFEYVGKHDLRLHELDERATAQEAATAKLRDDLVSLTAAIRATLHR